MHEAHLAAQEAAKAISSDLKSLEMRRVELGDAIDAPNNTFLDAENKIEKAREMIRKANLLLIKAESVRLCNASIPRIRRHYGEYIRRVKTPSRVR